MKIRLCIIQMHFTDLVPFLREYNCVTNISKSKIFDRIVIAAADVPENSVLKDWAKSWGVEVCFGSVLDVHDRISGIIEETGARTILRVLPQWFFLDINLINKMVAKIEEQEADYILLPRDYDIRFAGDLFSKKFFIQIALLFEQYPTLKEKYSFNPWGLADLKPEIIDVKIIEYTKTPSYTHKAFKVFKTRYNKVWPEHWDNADMPQFPYSLASNYIKNQECRALDIACGFGTGTFSLINSGASEVIGVDVSDNAIKHCQRKFLGVEKLSFVKGDALSQDFSQKPFDLVVTIHTMEHIIDDNQFLTKLKSWMKKNAIIVLEVPLLMKYPFKDSEEPYGDAHIREYYTNDLIELFSSFFKVKDAYGVCRGFYTELDKARNAVLLVGENSL